MRQVPTSDVPRFYSSTSFQPTQPISTKRTGSSSHHVWEWSRRSWRPTQLPRAQRSEKPRTLNNVSLIDNTPLGDHP
jgi:hypothetical protein